jgi:ribosomal protein S18 acetylase RimI-like enzyme
MSISLTDITIRTTLQPGDIGYITYLHGYLYKKEYNYGIQFECYVAQGLCEFYQQYDAQKDCVWIAEHNDRIVGFLLLMHRDKTAQLRYFIIEPEYRGVGLGKKMMDLYMEFMVQYGYTESFLWTTNELPTALALYRRYGFTLTEEKPSNGFGKPVTEQRYDLKL